MVTALRSQGVDAEIATTNDSGPDLLDVPLDRLTEYRGVPVRFFARFSPKNDAVREFAFSGTLTAWLWQHVREYDLLHVHAIFSYASTVAMAIARWQRVPYIVRPLGQLCHWSLQQSPQRKQAYLAAIELANLRGSAAIHVTSEQERDELASLNAIAPAFVLPHGISLPPALSSPRQRLREIIQVPEDEPILLFMSRLHPKKGLDCLIPALGTLKHRRFTLALVGSGSLEYEAEVDRYLAAVGISDRTYRPGFVPESEMKQLLLQGSDLFLLTSHSENFGLAVLEALGSGLPAIVTPGVALSSLVEREKVGWVTKLDVSAIASTIDSCLANPESLPEKGIRARQLVAENYSWERVAESLIPRYREIANIKNRKKL
jgi:glycosyltransferase involved in cell wall biosynthesis